MLFNGERTQDPINLSLMTDLRYDRNDDPTHEPDNQPNTTNILVNRRAETKLNLERNFAISDK